MGCMGSNQTDIVVKLVYLKNLFTTRQALDEVKQVTNKHRKYMDDNVTSRTTHVFINSIAP